VWGGEKILCSLPSVSYYVVLNFGLIFCVTVFFKIYLILYKKMNLNLKIVETANTLIYSRVSGASVLLGLTRSQYLILAAVEYLIVVLIDQSSVPFYLSSSSLLLK
jgi:hypothetical protein